MGLFNKGSINITINNRTIIRVIILAVATLFVLKFIDKVSGPLILIFVSFFLALALNPVVSWIAFRLKSKSRVRATAAAYLLVIAIIVSFAATVIPPLVNQTTQFISDVPTTLQEFQTQDSPVARFVRRYKLDTQIQSAGNDFTHKFKDYPGSIVSTAGRVGGIIVSMIAVLVLTFMMLVEGPLWLEKLWKIQQSDKREHKKLIASKMYKVVTGYVNGQLLVALIGAAFALLALLIASTVLNVSINVVAMAGIILFTGLIPLIGNTIGAIIVVLVALFNSATLAIVLAIYFLVYQQIENVTIQPYIQSRSNELTPLIVFVSALLGAGFGGLFGALIAIPVAGCIRVLLEDYFSHREIQS